MMEDGKEPVYASKAKPWLKYYEEKYIHQSVPECSAFALVCRNNERHLGDTALEYYGRKFSYADLIVQIKKTAAALQALGVKKGDIITVVSVMTPEVVYTFYAADLLGATLNLVDPRYSAEGIREYIQEVESRLLICLNVVYPRCQQAAKRTSVERVVVLSPADSLPLAKAVGYKLTEPARAMVDFLDDLSNWYVRRSRERFWAEGMEQDKINAYMTLYTVLETMVKLAAPFTPFITEEIYGNLVKKVDASAPESVHLCDWPAYHAEWVDADLEENMDFVLKVVVEGRAARNASAMKNRQPLAMMYVKAAQSLPAEYCDIIKDELNVEEYGAAFRKGSDVAAAVDTAFDELKADGTMQTLADKYGLTLAD